MGAPHGNQNARNSRLVADAIRRALAKSGGSLAAGLDKIADKLVGAAEAGQQWAISEIADRLDGRPKQTLDAHVEHTVNVGSSEELVPGLTRALELRTKPSVQ